MFDRPAGGIDVDEYEMMITMMRMVMMVR